MIIPTKGAKIIKLVVLITGSELTAVQNLRGQCCTGKSSDQSMRRRRRNTKPPGEKIPIMAAINPEKINNKCNEIFLYRFSNSIGNTMIFKNKKSNKIENGSPKTAWKGVNTLVETTVAIELAAS